MFRRALKRFHLGIENFYYKLGFLIGNNPSHFITFPIFLTILGAFHLQHSVIETNPEALYSPKGGKAIFEKRSIQKLYPLNYSAFDPSYTMGMEAYGRVIVTAKDKGSMLRLETWEEVKRVDEVIRGVTIAWDGELYNYEEICATNQNKCLNNNVFELDELIPGFVNGSTDIYYPIMLDPLVVPMIYGEPEADDETGKLLSAKALQFGYFLRYGNIREQERSKLWETKTLEVLKSAKFQYIEPHMEISQSLTMALSENGRVVVPYFLVNFVFMLAFAFWSVGYVDWVRSKFMMGVVGVISAVMSVVAAFGCCVAFGSSFTNLNKVILFLILGIGLDDQYVMIAAWHRTKRTDSVPVRLGETFRDAGMSITITSLTNILTFGAGMSSPIPVVSKFCLFSGVAIAFTFVWCISLCGAMLVYAGRAEASNKHALTFVVVKPKSVSKEKPSLYRWFCAGGIDPADPKNPHDNEDPYSIKFFRDYLAPALDKGYVKGIVIIVFIGYLAGGIYGVTQIQEGLDIKKLAPDNSYLYEYAIKRDMFREYPFRLQVVINETLQYSSNKIRNDIMELHKQFEESAFSAGELYTMSHIRDFYYFIDTRVDLRRQILTEQDFIRILKTEFFEKNKKAEENFVFTEDGSQIRSTRFIIQSYQIMNTSQEAKWMTSMRSIASQAPFKAFVFQCYFMLYEQLLITWAATLQAIIYAVIAMMVVAVIFIPNVLCCLTVVFSIISIEIGALGYMALWDVNLDPLSMINVIMCIGFSVDFSAHMSYAYITSKGATQKDRIRAAMEHLGLPIVQGGVSTILGVHTLIMTPSYLYRVFFKVIFCVIIFGMAHALILLPVLFSMISPRFYSNQETNEKQKSQCPNGNKNGSLLSVNRGLPMIVKKEDMEGSSEQQDLICNTHE